MASCLPQCCWYDPAHDVKGGEEVNGLWRKPDLPAEACNTAKKVIGFVLGLLALAAIVAGLAVVLPNANVLTPGLLTPAVNAIGASGLAAIFFVGAFLLSIGSCKLLRCCSAEIYRDDPPKPIPSDVANGPSSSLV